MFGFGKEMEIFACTFEIDSNGDMQYNQMQAPRFMIEQQFISLVQQAAQADFPVKIKLSRMAPVYDEFNDKWIEIENYITFENNMHSN